MPSIQYPPPPGGSSAGTESGRPIKDLGGLPSRPPVGAPVAPDGGLDTGASPGGYSIQPFNPLETAAQGAQESQGFLDGLKNALFGTSQADITGHHGGILGDIPVVGDITRAASETVANVGGAVGTVAKGALDVAGGTLEHINLPGQNTDQLKSDFAALPDSSAEKAKASELIAKDPGAATHYMISAIEDYNKANEAQGKIDGKPDFTTGAWRDWGSASEAVDNILGTLGLTSRLAERTFAGLDTPGQGGMDRLDLIMAVGNGQAKFNEDKGLLGTGILAGEQTQGGLNNIEKIVFQKVSSGEWTRSEALDFLSANNSGYSHSAIANIAGEVALDPMNLAGLGVAGIGKIGALGEKLANATAKAEEAVRATTDALDAARAAGKTDEVASLTAKLAEDQKALETVNGAYKQGSTASRLNPLGQLARSESATNLVRNLYKTYEPLQALHVDKALKVVRATVDPFGALSLHNPFRKQMIDLAAGDAVHQVIGAHGDVAHAQLIHALADATEGTSTPLADMFSEDIGGYSADLFRRVVARTQRDQAVAGKYVGSLMKKNVNEVLADLGDKVPKSYEEAVLKEANHFRIRTWDDTSLTNLADRLADNYGVKSSEEWAAWMKENKLNADQLSLLHAATYNRAQTRLQDAIIAAHNAGAGGDLADKLDRIILINRTTLTKQGADGILSDLDRTQDVTKQIELIKARQELYPTLRNFSLDETAPARTVERFRQDVKRLREALPQQVNDSELGGLPEDLRSMHTDKTFTLGFAPEDEYKWGLIRHNSEEGGWAPVFDVWTDHAASGVGYRPISRLIETNVAGQPIMGLAKPVGRALDYIEAGVKTMGRRVTGAVIADSARESFIQNAVHSYGSAGITNKVATDIMDALEAAVQNQDLVVRPSGFTTHEMWNAVRDVIPNDIRESDFSRRDLLALVLHAYQGDMRHVGVTQALSSRVKQMLAFEGNNASALAEKFYPFMKYRLNAIFQAQEKVEPWVLNSFRGIVPARSIRSLNEADKATAALLERMAQRSLVQNADVEMAEQAGKVLYGKTIQEMAVASNTALGKMTKRLGIDWEALRDVKGMKQINMLRTFRHGLAKDIKGAYEAAEPGLWDKMFEEATRRAGKGAGGLSEDEFAVSVMADKLLGNEVSIVSHVEDRLGRLARQFDKVDYKASISPGEWMAPQTLGELKPLQLDDMAELLRLPGAKPGSTATTVREIRAAVAAKKITVEDVLTQLRRFNADPDYIMRVKSALEFSWEGFFETAARDFNLTPERRRLWEEIIASAAEQRNMTPVDYLSQIMVPKIGLGSNEAVMGHLGQIENLLDESGNIKDQFASLAKLNVTADGAGTEEDFVRQLSAVFTQHLDPSAKVALMREFRPELDAQLSAAHDIDMETVNRLWTPEMDNEFARHVLGELNVRPENLGDLWDAGLLRTAQDWERVDPKQAYTALLPDGTPVSTPMHGLIGDGLRYAPRNVQKAVFGTVGKLRAEYPNVPLKHIDILDTPDFAEFMDPLDRIDASGTMGLIIETADGGTAMLLNKAYFHEHMAEDFAAQEAKFAGQANNLNIGGNVRESFIGAPRFATHGAEGTLMHEFGHSVDEHMKNLWKSLQKAGKGKTKQGRMVKRYVAFRDEFDNSLAGARLSEYARAHPNEAMADLHGLMLSGADPAEIDRATQAAVDQWRAGTGPQARWREPNPGKIADIEEGSYFLDYMDHTYNDPTLTQKVESALREWDASIQDADPEAVALAIKDFRREARKALKDAKTAYPDADIPTHPLEGANPKTDFRRGPQTVEDAVNQLKRIMQDSGEWKPRPTNPDFVAGANGLEPAVAQNPEVIRAVQMFGKWTNGVMGDYLRNGPNAMKAGVLEKVAGIPTHAAVPYNYTEHMMMSTAIHNMQNKWEDAHRLQYYSRSRTMLERSINHPIFGIYPASYMWGKMLPEMIRFMAKEPFGIKTGAAAYTYMDVMRDVALQREFDSSFGEHMDGLGHSASVFALGYMMPTWPWEASAAWPAYLREFGQEGLDMQSRVKSGGVVATTASGGGINAQQIGGKVADLVNPVKYVDRAVLQPFAEVNPVNPPKKAGEQFYLPPDKGPTAATDLADPLTQALSDLRGLLGG